MSGHKNCEIRIRTSSLIHYRSLYEIMLLYVQVNINYKFYQFLLFVRLNNKYARIDKHIYLIFLDFITTKWSHVWILFD